MITSFSLNKIHDELRDFWSPDYNEAVWVFDSFFSHSESDFNDELSDAFVEDRHRTKPNKPDKRKERNRLNNTGLIDIEWAQYLTGNILL